MASDKNFDRNWSAFKSGSKEAFACIYHEHVKVLLKYGYKIDGNHSFVEDCVQDLFIELWSNRANLSETTSVKFYLFQAIRYKILRGISLESRTKLAAFENERLFQESFECSLVDLEVDSIQMSHLKSTVNTLPARQREAINLRFYNNFSNEEVAQIMGVSYKSACRFIYIAIKKLKANLKVSVA